MEEANRKQPVEEEQVQKVAEQVEEASAPQSGEAETSEEIDSISDEALVSRTELEMEFEPRESSPVEVIEEPMDQQLIVPVHSAPDFANLHHLEPVQEIVDEKCEQVVVEKEESSVNLDDMFNKLSADAEKNKVPKTEEEEERERSMAEINIILEQTYTAIDLCDHRLVDGCDLREEDFDKDVEENVQVITYRKSKKTKTNCEEKFQEKLRKLSCFAHPELEPSYSPNSMSQVEEIIQSLLKLYYFWIRSSSEP